MSVTGYSLNENPKLLPPYEPDILPGYESDILPGYESATPPGNKSAHVTQEGIDVGQFALKIISSIGLVIINSLFTINTGAMKLTGFTVVTSFALGHLSKPIHYLSQLLTKHTFDPLKKWTQVIEAENNRIIETSNVFFWHDRRLMFSTKKYKDLFKDSYKMVMAPISISLSIVNAVAWVAIKPLWVVVFIPGFLAEALLCLTFKLNQMIGKITYAPLENLSNEMLKKHLNYLHTTPIAI